MDVARLNFSHGTPQDLLEKIKIVRLLNTKLHRRVKILGDLQGHRVRTNGLNAPVLLKKNSTVWLAQKNAKKTPETIPFDYQGSLKSVKNGHQIFLDDGNIVLKVVGKTKHTIQTKVVIGGLLKDRKGINIPEASLDFNGISRQDIEDIAFCQDNGVEFIAQSFVRSKNDVLNARKFIGPGSVTRLIAKIEDRTGVNNIDEIIEASDGVMIARGDMGVSLPIYEIPIVQKTIIKKCNRAKKFVITATQMLESMTENLRPTRAEVADVANAIIDGTDYVMLSAESAVGQHPVETVALMNKIIQFTENNL